MFDGRENIVCLAHEIRTRTRNTTPTILRLLQNILSFYTTLVSLKKSKICVLMFYYKSSFCNNLFLILKDTTSKQNNYLFSKI